MRPVSLRILCGLGGLTLLAGCAGQAAEPRAGQPGSTADRGKSSTDDAMEILRGTLAAGIEPKAPEQLAPRDFHGLDLLWSAQVGQTTFRSTMQLHEGRLVVPSNGHQLAGVKDRLDGVWVLDAKDGKQILKIVPPGGDEKDCNGVAVTDEAIFFGTDQEKLYRYTWKGEMEWTRKLDGDPEAAPALTDLDADELVDVAIGTDSGMFYAVDGETGKVLWKFATKAGDYGQKGVWGEAAVFDATGDGIADLFVPSRGQILYALDGKRGSVLWQGWGGSGRWGSPILYDASADGQPELYATESYGQIVAFDPSNGSQRWSASARIGLKGPVGLYPAGECIAVGSSWSGSGEEVGCFDVRTGARTFSFQVEDKNVTSGFVSGDIDGRPGDELIFATESGMLYALDPRGKVVWEEALDGPVEATPMLADVDGDDRVDIIVAVNDGFVRVYESAGRPSPTVAHHRGGHGNGGRL